jgi:RNA polymerase sigma factor (sigma-70 family)
MAPTNIVERLAELLELPVEVIQGKIGTVSDVQPRAHYATLKEVPDIPPAEDAPPKPPKKVENDLYEQWHDASAEEKPKFERRLFRVVRHARNVILGKIPEADENLPRDIASTVIERLAEFNGESKFTTWEHRVILNQCNLYLREKVKGRKRLYVSKDDPEDDIKLKDFKAEAAFAKVEQAVDLERIDRVAKGLSPEDYRVWKCWRDGMTMKATAEKLGIPEDSAENSLRRKVKPYLKEKIFARS